MALTMLWITKLVSILTFVGLLAVLTTAAENQTCTPSTESTIVPEDKSNSSQDSETSSTGETQLFQDMGNRQKELNSIESIDDRKNHSSHLVGGDVKSDQKQRGPSSSDETTSYNNTSTTERNDTDSDLSQSNELKNSTVPFDIDSNSSSEHSIAKRSVSESDSLNVTSESIEGPTIDHSSSPEENDSVSALKNKTLASEDLSSDNGTNSSISSTIDISAPTDSNENATGQSETNSDDTSITTLVHIDVTTPVDIKSTPLESDETSKTMDITKLTPEVLKSYSGSPILTTEPIPDCKSDTVPVAKSRGQRSPDKPKDPEVERHAEHSIPRTTEGLQYSTTSPHEDINAESSSTKNINSSPTAPIDYFDAVLNESFVSSSITPTSDSQRSKEFDSVDAHTDINIPTEKVDVESQDNDSTSTQGVSTTDIAPKQVLFTTQEVFSSSSPLPTFSEDKITTEASEKIVVSASTSWMTTNEKIDPTNEAVINKNQSEVVNLFMENRGTIQKLSPSDNSEEVILNDSPIEPLIPEEASSEHPDFELVKSTDEKSSKDIDVSNNASQSGNLSLEFPKNAPQEKQTTSQIDKANKMIDAAATVKPEVVHPKNALEIPISNVSDVSNSRGSVPSTIYAVTASPNSNISDTTFTPLETTEYSKNLGQVSDSLTTTVHLTNQQSTTEQSVQNTSDNQENKMISSDIETFTNATVDTNSSTTMATSTSAPEETATRRNVLKNLKPGLKNDESGSMSFTRRPITTTTKRPIQSDVGAQVSIFKRNRTRVASITSSTTPGTTTRYTYRGVNKPVRIVGTETFSFDSLPMTTPSTTTETEEPEEEDEVVELEEGYPSSHEDRDKSPSYSDDDDVTLMKYSASTVVIKGMRWKQQLNSRLSPEYKKQEQKMHQALDRLFRDSAVGQNLWKIEIDGFSERPGSKSRAVEVDYSVYLVKTDSILKTIELVRAFNERLVNNTFSRYTFDPMFTNFNIMHEEKLNKPTEAPEVEPPIPQWAIAVIVIGAASFIFIVLFAAVTVYGRHHMKRKYASKLDEDMERSVDSREWEKKLGAAAYENLAADVVYDADDSCVGNVDSMKRRKYIPPNPPRNPRMKHYDSWRTEWTDAPKRARLHANRIIF